MKLANVYRDNTGFSVQVWDSAKGGAKLLATMLCNQERSAINLAAMINANVEFIAPTGIPANSRMSGLWDRMFELGKRGADADVNHPDRKQYDDLKSELKYMGATNL